MFCPYSIDCKKKTHFCEYGIYPYKSCDVYEKKYMRQLKKGAKRE